MSSPIINSAKRKSRRAQDPTWNKGPAEIRRMLTEKTVLADDWPRRFHRGRSLQGRGRQHHPRSLSTRTKAAICEDVPLLERVLASRSWPLRRRRSKQRAGAGSKSCPHFPGTDQREYRVLKPLAPALGEEEEIRIPGPWSEEFEGVDQIPEARGSTAETKKKTA